MNFHKHEEFIKKSKVLKSNKNDLKFFERVGEIMIKDFNNKPYQKPKDVK